ncbi:hypothetical protein HDU96_008249 [Phlyctochytrium bullatum]|nr:hypothetical protein HDU96_008249 [Phlyctochytrium bullatum]
MTPSARSSTASNGTPPPNMPARRAPSPILSFTLCTLAILLLSALAALGTGMCTTFWYTFHGPHRLPTFILIRDTGLFRECTFTNLNLTTGFPISKTANHTCQGLTHIKCDDFKAREATYRACLVATAAGTQAIMTPGLAGLALVLLAAAFLTATYRRAAGARPAKRVIHWVPTVVLSGLASLAALGAAISALLSRRNMLQVFDVVVAFQQEYAGKLGVPFGPVEQRAGFRVALGAVVTGFAGALVTPAAVAAMAAWGAGARKPLAAEEQPVGRAEKGEKGEAKIGNVQVVEDDERPVQGDRVRFMVAS